MLKLKLHIDTEAEAWILWPPDTNSWLMGNRPWCWERLRSGGEGGQREWYGWMALLTYAHEFEETLGVSEVQRSLACCSSWGCKEWYTTEQLNNKNKATVSSVQFRSGWDELPHARGQGRRLRGATPHPRRGSCTGTRGPRELLHIQGQEGWSWGDTPLPR